MTLRAEETVRFVTVHGGAIEQSQHAAHLVVEFLGGVLALHNLLLVSLGQIVAVVGIGLTHGQSVGPSTELEVESVLHSLVGIMTAAPVADHYAVEAPILLQNLVEHGGVVAVVHTLIQVVGTHDGPCPTLLNGSLEGWQIDFVQGAIANHHVYLVAILLVVVQCIVLYAGSNTLRLQSLNVRHYHARCQPGVFAHVLEVTSAQRCAIDIHTRTQHHALVAIQCLLGQTLTVETCQLRIPCGSQTGECRESHTRVVGLSGLFPLVPKHIGANAVRTVVGPQIGESQTLYTRA